MSLVIVADENIALLDEIESQWGTVTRLPGRDIKADDLREADMLLVRSVTPVNADLLTDTPVRFVGTATIGEDHIDRDYLRSNGIAYASAPGCNARAVVDYVTAALFNQFSDSELQAIQIGIAGYGNVGRALVARLAHLGMTYKVFDPFVDNVPSAVDSFDALLSCDVLSLHVPLTYDGSHPTYHMVNTDILKAIKPDAVLINTSRGAVINNTQLLTHLRAAAPCQMKAILDVWENEPRIDLDLLSLATIGTGHIAGYSRQGKERGTAMIAAAAAEALALPSLVLPEMSAASSDPLEPSALCERLRAQLQVAVPLKADSERLKCDLQAAASRASGADEAVATAFDAYRKTYPLREELPY